MGLVIPLVNTTAQARDIVSCAKYPPRGRRGFGFAVARDDFQGGDVGRKMEHPNDNVRIVAQIETAEGLENAAEIAAGEGIDALWIGQFDLTASLGIPGEHAFTGRG
jgi:2-dehydro-3-deoxyglucarate aldolase/4-hydroxy-2-oxoheptanedioate aldolase